jgi:hypothetical protein
LYVSGFSAAIGLITFSISYGILGNAAWVLGITMSIAAGYILATEPRRLNELARIRQAKEAPLLGASVSVRLQATGSRSRTTLGLASSDEGLASYLDNLQKNLLLGFDSTKLTSQRESVVASESVSRILQTIDTLSFAHLEESGLELESLLSSSALGEETKTPIFIAASFFSPIMLVLLAALTHTESVTSLVALGLIDMMILDLAFRVSSTDRENLRV